MNDGLTGRTRMLLSRIQQLDHIAFQFTWVMKHRVALHGLHLRVQMVTKLKTQKRTEA